MVDKMTELLPTMKEIITEPKIKRMKQEKEIESSINMLTQPELGKHLF